MAAAICAGTPPPLRWNAANIYYMDGSCLDTEAGQRIGAAVVRPAGPNGGPQQWAVDPCGAGPTNTINRAELAAILRALQAAEQDTPAPGRVTIATDSACSLFQIRQQLSTPKTLLLSKHRELLREIARVIEVLATRGQDIHLIKVKAHTGVLGNEAADQLAKQTAQGQVPNGVACKHVHEGRTPYQDLYWPATPPNALSPTPGYLGNLTDALHKAVLPGNATGGANIGIYAQLWATTATHMEGAASNHMWTATGVTHAARRATLQARFGVLYNAKIAARMHLPYAPCPTPATARGLCPLCGAEDSIGHILGGCSHPNMHALYIQRHDQACRLVVKAMRAGKQGGMYILTDAGTAATLTPLGVTDKRIPIWLLPAAPSRPDI
jgi:ribonuclease HI